MAELSQETQAIIDRLKAEGDLNRNSGTNSVRSVKIKMDQFQGLFESISANIIEQTAIMQSNAGMAVEALEREKSREQFEELVAPDKNKPDSDDKKPLSEVGEKTGDSIAKALSMKNLALGAAGLFVGFNLLKGFIDEETDGGFSKMQATISNIKWGDVETQFKTMTSAVTAINWTNFSDAINNMSNTVNTFTTWIGETGISDILTKVVGAGLVGVGVKGAVAGMLAGTKGAGMGARLAAIGPGLALAAAGLAVYYGDDIKDYITAQTGAESPEMQGGIENLVTVGQVGLAALSIAMLFGGGPLSIAVVAATAAVGMGVLIKSWIDKNKRVRAEEFAASVDKAMAAVEAATDPTNLENDELRLVGEAMAEARRRTQLAIGGAARNEAQAAIAELESVIAEQNVGDGSEGVNALQLDRLRKGALAGDEESIAELIKWAQGRAIDTEGSIMRWRPFGPSVTNQEFSSDIITSLGRRSYSDKSLTPEQQMQQAKDWEAITEGLINRLNFPGSNTPQDPYSDGNGSSSNLVPSAAIDKDGKLIIYDEFGNGRLLNNIEMKGSLGNLLRSDAGGAGGGVAVASVSPVVAPTYIMQGGSEVKQITFKSGNGMNDGSLLPYGMTSAFA
jgi:hypothetical protein|tara:strand:- start:14443 stop:16305 length:1863 start_codon:yes stop_codon:yes gene_type:complete